MIMFSRYFGISDLLDICGGHLSYLSSTSVNVVCSHTGFHLFLRPSMIHLHPMLVITLSYLLELSKCQRFCPVCICPLACVHLLLCIKIHSQCQKSVQLVASSSNVRTIWLNVQMLPMHHDTLWVHHVNGPLASDASKYKATPLISQHQPRLSAVLLFSLSLLLFRSFCPFDRQAPSATS